jgi:hypothetical protein
MSLAPYYNTPAEIKALIDERLTQGLTQTAIIQYWLRYSALSFAPIPLPYSLRQAVVVSIDSEWWEYVETKITELGVSIVESSFVHNTSYTWPVLDTMVTQHVRIKDNAHLVNNDFCEGHPNKFEFGKTSFVTIQEARTMLKHSFERSDKNNKPRPVIFVGHAVDNDIEIIKERFGFEIEALGVVVATIYTQVLSREIGIAPPPGKPKLKDLLRAYGINEWHLHNAGNDAACTIVATILMSPVYPMNHGQWTYNNLKQIVQNTIRAMAIYGTQTYCVKCDSHTDIQAHCMFYSWCQHCAASSGCALPVLHRVHRPAPPQRTSCVRSQERELHSEVLKENSYRWKTIENQLKNQS